MSRRRRRITKATRPTITPAATYTAEQVQALLQSRSLGVTPISPLPRLPEYPFGPGVPIIPAPLDPARDDGTGRPEPRIYEYPVSINLPGMTDRLVPWKVLRDAAEIPVVRDCIRIRKNQIAALEWDVVISKRALQQYKKQDPDTSSVKIKRELREKLDPDVGRLIEFWQQPDWQQGESFVEWATKVLEEHLVLDAVAVYPFTNRAGDRIGLRALDGSTVKPLLDHQGGRPLPPSPAYQQVLWGFPRGEFVADTDQDGRIPNGYSADRLIYRRREVRTFTPYGMSQVEQALQDVDLYLRRMEWDKAQYTEGVQPAGWIKNTGLESWTPQQIIDYNRAFNDLYAGQTLNRMRYHLLPPGMEPMESADIAEKYKPDYHLHLIKLVAMHFDVTIAELGFTEAKGLGSAGYHEGQENVQQRKATNPDLRWLQAVLTDISRTHLGMPNELEFRFLGLDAEDEAAADDVIESQVKSGRITLNEAREEQGRAPYAFAEADMPVVETARGIIFLENASQLVEPGQEVTPVQAPPLTAPPEGGDADDDDAEPDGSDNPAPVVQQRQTEAAKKPAVGQTAESAKKTELAAYRKWLRNGHNTGRRFVFKHLTPSEAADLAKGVEPGPKAGDGRRWPAWDTDLAIADHWAGELRSALGAVPTRAIALRWLAARKTTDPGSKDRQRDALTWLTATGLNLTPAIRQALTGLYTDAYMVGDQSAQTLLGEIEHPNYGAWAPGDTATAKELIDAAGSTSRLGVLLDQAGTVAEGINGTRMRALADTLGDALIGDTTVDELDERLTAVLDDETAADMIGLTETSRAISTAATDRYTIGNIRLYEWVTAPGACPLCLDNEAVGPIPLGQSFPSGGAPPAHPYCRCAVLPVLNPYSALFGL